MNRRGFLLSLAAASFLPATAIARPRVFKRHRNNTVFRWVFHTHGQTYQRALPVIRFEKGMVANHDYLFDNIPYEGSKEKLGTFHREVHAWINKTDAIRWDKKESYYGEVLVRQYGARGCWCTATMIQRLPESRIL